MGTVGINFGAATSGAGFDVAATVTSILGIESAIETPWKSQLTSLQAKDTALSTLGTNLSALSTAVSGLTNFDGVLAQKQGASSNTGVLALSAASSSAIAGSHTITVTSLATTSSKYSTSVASTDVLSGSLTLRVGSATARTITIDSSSNTLSSLASTINNGSYGVTASVVTDTNGSRLSLVSVTSGSAGEITLTSQLTNATQSSSVSFSAGQTGADAKFNVDGLDTTSASNTVSGAIPGVTFQLLAPSPDAPVQVQITNDNAAVETTVQSLVTAYNAVVSSIKTQEGNDATGAAQPLFGDPTLALLQTQLSASLLGGKASGAISNIGQLGLSLGQDGKLTLDVSTLDNALNASYGDISSYFQAAGSFGQTFSTALNSLGTSSTQGAISLAIAQNTSQEANINANIASEDLRVAADKTRITAELTTANQILQDIPQQLNEINQIYSAITGYNSKQS